MNPKVPMGGTTDAWLVQNADRLDFPDAGDPFRSDIQVAAPAETVVRLEAIYMGILPGCRFYELDGCLYRVHQDATFALYGSGEWQPIEGATLRTDAAREVTADAARAAVEASRRGESH